MTDPLWAVLPAGIDDPAAPSGGNRYDRKVLNLIGGGALAAAAPGPGIAVRDVHEIAISGSWPDPDATSRAALHRALSDIPEMSDVLIDGLVACGVPEVLEPHHKRLRLVILVHLPLSDETGLSETDAARLRGRERATLRLADTVIATSETAARHISDMHDLADTVTAAIPGVDPAPAAEPAPGGGRLLCVASVTPRKGQDLLVEVLEQDLADLSWSCTFVGALTKPVPYTSANIRFTGPKAGAELDAAYADADLFVLPSRA